jgi:integrase
MWSELTIYPKNPESSDMDKTWRVRFRFFYAGKWHQISRKADLNTISNYKERVLSANSMITALKLRLERGWNPVTNTYPSKLKKEIDLEELQQMQFSNALDFAELKLKPTWKYKTSQDYSSKIKYLKNACDNIGITKPIREFRKIDFKLILEQVIADRKLGNDGYNAYRSFLSGLVSELVEWDIMESNLIRDIKTRDTLKKVAHRPPTQDERITIVSHIKEYHRNYFRFLSLIYGCGIRPKEITQIKINMLHKLQGVFRLPAEITKNGVESDVAIPEWVMDLLMEMKLEKYDPEFYIFAGKGNMFMPGKNKMHSNSTTLWWNNIVKKGLKLNVDQYSLKKLSADDLVRLKRREGADNLLSLAKEHFRHSDERVTATYTGEHKNLTRELIKAKMPRLDEGIN